MANNYNDALERARRAIIDCGSNASRKEMIYGIFPELRESEEDKIKKELITFLRDVANGSVKSMPSASMCQEWLAYLEKQKEQKSARWDEKDEKMIQDIIESIGTGPIAAADYHKMEFWLHSLPERIK